MKHPEEAGPGPAEPAFRLAAAIADGETIDWEGARGEDPGLDTLKLVELIAAAHRRVREESTATLARPAGAAAESSAALPSGTRWGRLIIEERIGAGSYGEVYRARDPMLEQHVALKLRRRERSLGPEEEKEFLEEARRLARVKHPHVVAVYGADIQDGRMGIWMEYLKGTPLDQLPGSLTWEEAGLIGLTLCQALGAVHGAGLVHRDVKPGNVFRAADGRIVLLDLGSAADRPAHGKAGDGAASGTPYYMAPEAWFGKTTPASDVYSLGVTLFTLVSGKHPVTRRGVDILSYGAPLPDAERLELREAAPHLPRPFVQVVERALDQDPERRYPTIWSMERALASALGMEPAVVPPTSVSWWRRWQVLVPAAAALTAVLLWFLLPRPGPTPARIPFEAELMGGSGETVRALKPGEAVQVGDQLYLDVRTAGDAWLYVATEDQEGRVHALFPNPELDTKNPVRGNRSHRLPGPMGGTSVNWKVDTAGGRETILLVATSKKIDALEDEWGRLPLASLSASGSGRDAETTAQRLRAAEQRTTVRGVGQMVPATEDGMIPLLEEFVREVAPGAGEFWTRRFEFRSEDGAEPSNQGEAP